MEAVLTSSPPPETKDAENLLERYPRVIPYPPIEQHGIIGDRRTAALISTDGTLDWACLPDFDGPIIFGALLDWAKGGHWRLGPALLQSGQQSYEENHMVLQTRWELETGVLVLQDTMLWPQSDRPPEQKDVRVVVRSLRCVKGRAICELDLQAGYNFQTPAPSMAQYASGFNIQLPELSLRLWTNYPPEVRGSRLHREFELSEGEELWAVLELGAAGHGWTVESAKAAMESTRQYWQDWVGKLRLPSVGGKEIPRTAMIIHLLTYAPSGSIVAAPTTSLPERIGGGWNADYRLCWVRDASLAVSSLVRLGNLQETEQYLQWLIARVSRFGNPLQVLYDIRGGTRPKQKKLSHASGYQESQPVRIGNHAYKQRQLGSYGYLADCVWLYLEGGGQWRDEYWELICRVANYTAKHWQEPGNGLWELPEPQQYLNSKILGWVMLDRALRIAGRVKASFDTSLWQGIKDQIRTEILTKGWSDRLGAFRQRYEAENLDATALLASVLEVLPGDDPRVLSTMDRISRFLAIDGFVYRFNPLETPGLGSLPLGQLEGAFFPSTFWLATAWVKAGHLDKAQALLNRAEGAAGPLGLFSEAIDPRTHSFLGNTPLLFSHVEYVRAKLDLAAESARH